MVSGPSLTPELLRCAERAEEAASNAGLTFFDVVFEMLDAADVNAVAAYGGFPVRYSSWRFGMEYERLARGYDWGLSKIYELVVNHDPTIAYLVRSNSLMEQKLVMAHVFGHADFFRNSAWFAPTERQMLERFDDHARRIQESVDRFGQDRVERLLDRALSLEPLMDPHGPLRAYRAAQGRAERGDDAGGASLSERARASLGQLMDGAVRSASADHDLPTFDVLQFLCRHADVEPWEREVLWIVHAEAEYFLPQRMTKIINEGWASLWHSRLLTGGLLDASEVVEFADCHSGATQAAPGQLNPYKLGLDLFRHAERRGMDVFRLRAVHNDVSFVDEVLDAEFAARSSLFVTDPARRGAGPRIGTRDPNDVKQALLRSLAWGGQPRIELVEVHEGAVRDMVLRHDHDGRDLKLDEAGEMLRTIESLWKGPVHLLTREGEEARRLTCDQGELRMRDDASGKPRARAEAS
ncbi:MAG: SpoVR family protein [Planctomycetota bacterium]